MAAKGLGALRRQKAEAQAEREANAGGRFFNLKVKEVGDVAKVKIRVLQELDEDATNFSAEAGTAVFNTEWSNPDDFTKVISDTMHSEGRCVGREKSNELTGGTIETGARAGQPETGWNKGWRPKEFMYVNVLVDDGENEPYVKPAKFNMNEKAVQANVLIDCHDNNGSVTDRWFAVTKTKTGPQNVDVQWKMTPLDRDKDLPPVTDYELVDLESLLPTVPYAKQREALGLFNDTPSQPVGQSAPVDAQATTSVSW